MLQFFGDKYLLQVRFHLWLFSLWRSSFIQIRWKSRTRMRWCGASWGSKVSMNDYRIGYERYVWHDVSAYILENISSNISLYAWINNSAMGKNRSDLSVFESPFRLWTDLRTSQTGSPKVSAACRTVSDYSNTRVMCSNFYFNSQRRHPSVSKIDILLDFSSKTRFFIAPRTFIQAVRQNGIRQYPSALGWAALLPPSRCRKTCAEMFLIR